MSLNSIPTSQDSENNVDLDVTAVISILKDEQNNQKDSDSYIIQVLFVGSTLLPPFLPQIRRNAKKTDKEYIARKLGQAAGQYEKYMHAEKVGESGSEMKMFDELKKVGSTVVNLMKVVRKILRKLTDLRVRHVIFHTDEYEFPWPLAYYPLLGAKGWRFCCEFFSCGTVFVDKKSDAFDRFTNYLTSGVQPSANLKQKGNICLFGGSLGVIEQTTNSDIGELYIKRLETFLRSEGEKLGLGISCYSAQDWVEYGGRHKALILFLNEKVKRAQIIHITAHVDHKAVMHFSEDTFVTPDDLIEELDELTSRPLVVLHGCSTGQVHEIKQEVAQLSQIFLEKGASGCLACLLPVCIPVSKLAEKERPSTFIELFYRNVLDVKPYGEALLEAREEFKSTTEGGRDPQWLFFQLYGDPRARAISPTSLTVPSVLKILEKTKERKKTKGMSKHGKI